MFNYKTSNLSFNNIKCFYFIFKKINAALMSINDFYWPKFLNGVCDGVLYVTLLDCFNLDVSYWTVSINLTLPADSSGWNALNVFLSTVPMFLSSDAYQRPNTVRLRYTAPNFLNNYKTLEHLILGGKCWHRFLPCHTICCWGIYSCHFYSWK